ncbi:cobalt chelatase [Paenalcaligenes niemegkensis]|uniref:cobaltochelatase CobT-related protein n=1 Tax=Paenalcaligenes niemegkensis TaxID=2895469 RepID=UPI001EE786A6|nr:cobalt chelatase [Paenalcaligenes niemegkensis]MCQ9615719.1 cobalt chelatase [Paenalcaligenes niemegkensis]
MRLHEEEKLEFLRGVADSLALRLLYSDAVLHQALLPEQPIARLVFDWLESLRTESLAPAFLPGVKANLHRRFYHWSAGFHQAGHTHSALGILLYTAVQMCWSRLNGMPVYEETEDLIEGTRASIGTQLGHLVAALRRHRTEQRRYAPYAAELAELLSESITHAAEEQRDTQPDDDDKALDAFALLLDLDTGQEGTITAAQSEFSKTFEALHQRYQIFDTQFDTQSHIAEQVRPELLISFREQINKRIAAQNLSFNLLVHRIRQALNNSVTEQWIGNQEEGLIDGSRLSQLISSPMDRHLFTYPTPQHINQSSVSFLIDCSGSMKESAETVTMMVDLLSRALEHSGATTEVLGFSTHAWNGGRPYRRWVNKGRQSHPGRLNETDHRIFKDAHTPWRQASQSIMALLKLDLYREGVDGEAVQWACHRLLEQPTQRKLLYVISDGSPMDSATNLANDDNYLTSHLQQVLLQYERQGIEIWGVGINLDLSLLYPHSLLADLHKGLDNHFINDFIKSLHVRRR